MAQHACPGERRRRALLRWTLNVLCGCLALIGLTCPFIEGRFTWKRRTLLIGEGAVMIIWPADGYNCTFWDDHAAVWVARPSIQLFFPRLEVICRDQQLVLPAWLPLLLSFIPAGIAWFLRPARHPEGHCAHCGYDLTGNVSRRCPECGSVVPPAAT